VNDNTAKSNKNNEPHIVILHINGALILLIFIYSATSIINKVKQMRTEATALS
jgi:hypothetical protein